MARDNIRNFCIIAHIDHGKSTLSDRILELTKSVDERTMEDQILDNMDIERERGITIKARAVTLNYTAKDGKTYEFNLIDTPGHVDFAYEVSRSLAACEGAILVVDATQGVEAQTLANTYMALEHDLELVPILNKIDLPSAHPDEVAQEVEDVIGLPCMDAPRVSAKTGLNVDQVLERVVSDIPAPTGDPDAPLKALIFDSIYDSYKGVIVYIRVFEGTVKPGDTIKMMATGAEFTLVEVGHMGATSLTPCSQLQAGERKELALIVKADVQGSVEAVKASLEKLSNDEVNVRVIHGAVGAINESDVMLASTSQAIIVGFNVRPDSAARESAARQNVDMRMYRVIYDAIDEIETAMKGMLAPKYREVVLGHAEVRQTYKVSGVGTVAGCYVQDGKLQRKDCQVRLVRDGIVIHEGVLASLQRFKDSVKEVQAGYECGLSIEKFNDIKEGDVVECFIMEEIPR